MIAKNALANAAHAQAKVHVELLTAQAQQSDVLVCAAYTQLVDHQRAQCALQRYNGALLTLAQCVHASELQLEADSKALRPHIAQASFDVHSAIVHEP